MKKYILYLLLLTAFFPFFNARAERLMTDQKIQCGFTEGQKGGEVVECDVMTHACIVCTETKKGTGWKTALTAGAYSQKVQVYKCVSQGASYGKSCKLAMNGGLEGDEWSNHLWGLVRGAEVQGKNCIVYNYFIKYANCYGCVVVQTLTSAFTKAAGKAYNVSKEAANIIALIGMALWLSMFALKNVSSFATLEPMKMLQEFFVQCFKVILALVIINSGLKTIINYILIPIVSTGTDIADTITANVSDVISGNVTNLDADDFKTSPDDPGATGGGGR